MTIQNVYDFFNDWFRFRNTKAERLTTFNELREILGNLLPQITGGAATPDFGGSFSALPTTVLPGGNQYITLIADTALTVRAGVVNSFRLYVKQDGTGNHTLSINGQALTISATAGSGTIIEVDIINGFYVFSINTSPASVAMPDTTPPTIVSVTATDAHHVQFVFSEAVTGNTSGFQIRSNGVWLTITAQTGNGTNTKTFTITETMLNTDALTYNYFRSSGNTTDTSFNVLEDSAGPVINAI